jgi:hypothetical protein
MSERRTKLANTIVDFWIFLRANWVEILSIGLTLLGLVHSILEFTDATDF